MALVLNGTTGVQDNSGAFVRGTSVSASGTSIDFTSIPSWVKRISVVFDNVSTNGLGLVQIQLGTSSGFVTSGYSGGVSFTSVSSANSSALLIEYSGGPNAGTVRNGSVLITNVSSNTWISSGNINWNGPTLSNAGGVSLGGTLDRVRITTSNGTDAFDAGSINILWE